MSFLDNTGLAYFYSKLKEKFIRSITAGNDVLTPDASGNVNIVNVPTANNLTSPDAQTSYGTFVYRTSGGSASLTSGDAQLMYVDGNIEIVGRKEENFDITATNSIVISYDAAVWRLTNSYLSVNQSTTVYWLLLMRQLFLGELKLLVLKSKTLPLRVTWQSPWLAK